MTFATGDEVSYNSKRHGWITGLVVDTDLYGNVTVDMAEFGDWLVLADAVERGDLVRSDYWAAAGPSIRLRSYPTGRAAR